MKKGSTLIIFFLFVVTIFLSGCSLNLGDTAIGFNVSTLKSRASESSFLGRIKNHEMFEKFSEGISTLGFNIEFGGFFESSESCNISLFYDEMLNENPECLQLFPAKEKISEEERELITLNCPDLEEIAIEFIIEFFEGIYLDFSEIDPEDTYELQCRNYSFLEDSEKEEFYCHLLTIEPLKKYSNFPVEVNAICFREEVCGETKEKCENKCNFLKGCVN